ncbi:MAG TPA: histidine phosphatase family protein [Caldilineaceae bacterium]|nr:histidine phosphatase family protein [Caldilineaceae bacterium]
MQTELILIRHGETVWNAQGRFQGQQDSPLTPKGVAQAQAIAAYLSNRRIDALYTSDLGRTLETARYIAGATGLPVVSEPALRERNLGILEGLTHAEAESSYPAEFARYLAREPDFVLPQGESLLDLERRACEALAGLAERHRGERVAVVSHGGLLTAFIRCVLGVPVQLRTRFALRNASLSRALYNGSPDEWIVLTLGEVAHLDGLC